MAPGIIKITTTKVDGDMHDEKNRQGLMECIGLPFSMLTTAEQVHGSAVHSVTGDDAGRKIHGADGLVTNIPGLPLGVFTADCVPVFLSEINKRAVRKIGILHVGWRGLCGGIIENGVSFFDKASNLFVHIGPHICERCYTVNSETGARFLAGYKNGRLDLAAEIKYRLKAAGVPSRNITCANTDKMCTYHRQDLFYSYRRGDKKERMLSLIIRRNQYGKTN